MFLGSPRNVNLDTIYTGEKKTQLEKLNLKKG